MPPPWNDSTHSFISSSSGKGNRGTDREEETTGLGLRLYTENKAPRCWQVPQSAGFLFAELELELEPHQTEKPSPKSRSAYTFPLPDPALTCPTPWN